MSFIEIKDIHYKLHNKDKGSRDLYSGLTLSLEKHEMAALVGANGVGKTTLTKMMLGFLKPDRGLVKLDGHRSGEYRRHEVGSKVGYLFQNPTLQLFSATVEEELLFAYEVQGTVTEAIRARSKEIIRKLSLTEALETPVFHLSQGEKQRLAIGTLLMNKPEFLILDEPTSGLDGERKDDLKGILMELNEEGIGMLIITHDHDFINDLSLKVCTMSEGQVTVHG